MMRMLLYCVPMLPVCAALSLAVLAAAMTSAGGVVARQVMAAVAVGVVVAAVAVLLRVAAATAAALAGALAQAVAAAPLRHTTARGPAVAAEYKQLQQAIMIGAATLLTYRCTTIVQILN
jgi:hypothetical protein